MNSKAIYAACLFAALNVCTLSARAESVTKHENYAYGTHLDIKKVLSSTQDSASGCGVVNSHLTYLNSQGQQQMLDYSGFSEVCNQGG
ncbi:MAG: hypothetical protein JWP80_3971 [Pseudomonas sp.]|nr:hypothetical protein [Pseudomonas sp.]